MNHVTLTDAAGVVIGHVDAAGRRHMLRPDPVKPPRMVPTFFERAARSSRMFKVNPEIFLDAAMDDGADRSISRQHDAEMRRVELHTLISRDEAVE